MLIAFSAENKNGLESSISHHFGRCPAYILVDLKDGEVQSVKSIDNPFFQDHIPGMVPRFINEQGVNVMISGGMGRRAIEFFEQFGIGIATGAQGSVQFALQSYLDGKLVEAAPCRQSIEHDH
ncbi:MAG: NifB/NifX family molybdenum-iron cluster-binding protein [Anaerolineales bacterium]|jgi:predicted Fe-Mo cluster-binding NifX family protein